MRVALIVSVARRATCWASCASVTGAFSLTWTWMVAWVAASASFSENEVAEAEKSSGMVTTAENRPDARPSEALGASAKVQVTFSPSRSIIAAASWRPSGTI